MRTFALWRRLPSATVSPSLTPPLITKESENSAGLHILSSARVGYVPVLPGHGTSSEKFFLHFLHCWFGRTRKSPSSRTPPVYGKSPSSRTLAVTPTVGSYSGRPRSGTRCMAPSLHLPGIWRKHSDTKTVEITKINIQNVLKSYNIQVDFFVWKISISCDDVTKLNIICIIICNCQQSS